METAYAPGRAPVNQKWSRTRVRGEEPPDAFRGAGGPAVSLAPLAGDDIRAASRPAGTPVARARGAAPVALDPPVDPGLHQVGPHDVIVASVEQENRHRTRGPAATQLGRSGHC